MKRIISIISIALAASMHGQAQQAERSITHFGLDMYKHTASNKNMVFSPFSISPTMAMVAMGAKGTTLQQMAQTLHFEPCNQQLFKQMGQLQQRLVQYQQVELCIANRTWMEQSFTPLRRYRRKLKRNFEATAHTLNFSEQPNEARAIINSTIADDTKGHIDNLLPLGSINSSTQLVLTNAIYFKGKWELSIDPKNTKMRDFYPSDGSTTQCSTMFVHDTFGIYHGDGYDALQMDYQGRELSMLIVLPHEGTPLADIETRLSPTMYQATLDGMSADDKVKVYLPKFKISTSLALKPTLCSMGMPLAFSSGADFSGINKNSDLMIDNVYHKAFIEVSEEGTTASAATAAVMVRKTAVMRDKVFRANRPFIFILKDNPSGTILFMGKVERPS